MDGDGWRDYAAHVSGKHPILDLEVSVICVTQLAHCVGRKCSAAGWHLGGQRSVKQDSIQHQNLYCVLH